MSTRPTLVLGGHGLLLGWHGPLGPGFAEYDRWSRAVPQQGGILGRPDRDRAQAPAVGHLDGAMVLVWCEDDGAWSCTLGDDGPRDVRSVLPGAHRVALAGRTLFAADEDGIVALDLSAEPGTEPERVVQERRASVRMTACAMRDEALLLYAYDGDSSWGVVTRKSGRSVAVRHQTQRPVRDLALAAAGSRAGVGLELEGGQVRFAALGPEAKVVERPHAVFDRHAVLAHPQVVWIERRFWVLARRPDGELVATSIDGTRGFSLPEVRGPFAAAYYRQHVHVLEVETEGEDAEMQLWRCDAEGGSPQQRVDAIIVSGAIARRQRLEARGVLRGLSLQFGRTAGYRGMGQRAWMDDERAELRLTEDDGTLSVSLEPRESRWVLVVSEGGAEEPPLADPPGSLLRLARWVRHRLSAQARERYEVERARAEALASSLDATLARFELAGAGRWLELELAALPAPEALHRWLQRVRATE